MTFERARAIADAVLFEGYALYPYRVTALKNRYRWTFGVLSPKQWSDAGGCEASFLEAQVLARTATPRLHARLRFLRVVRRTIEVEGQRVESLDVDGTTYLPWEEGELTEIDVDVAGTTKAEFAFPQRQVRETILDARGDRVGTVVRDLHALSIAVDVRVESLSDELSRIAVRVENATPFVAGAERADVMQASLASTHLLLLSESAPFASVRAEAADTAPYLKTTRSTGTYPVLVDEQRRDLLLCSPIILEEPPGIAPESPFDLFDSGEIDEILTLRTKLLTPEEKILARATDARTRDLVDRVEGLSDEAFARLHGGVRDRPPPVCAPGARVRLYPSRGGRRTDVQDLLYEGHEATVEAVLDDIDGRKYLAVTIDDDPAADLHRWYGRLRHYYPDEVELIGFGGGAR